MKRISIAIAILAFGTILTQAAFAGNKPTTSTTTAQSIMVDFNAAGTYTIVRNDTYHYNLNAAAGYFQNGWDQADPSSIVDKSDAVTSRITGISGTAPASEPPCNPSAPAFPAAPAADAFKVLNNQHPGQEDVVGDNRCNFLDGDPLVVGTKYAPYTQTATAKSDSCTYNTYQQNGNKYTKIVHTVVDAYTYTYTYNVTPVTPGQFAPLTAWDYVGSTGSNSALVSIDANIAGESVNSTKQWSRKYSFSLSEDSTGRISRVQNLMVSLYDSLNNLISTTPAGSTVVHNLSNSVSTKTAKPGDFVIGPNGELDFYYVGNAGSNGVTSLLYIGSEDARTILNTDSVENNNNGGSDGEALTAAIMDTVQLDLPVGDYTVNLTGMVKDNAGISNLPINVTQIVHIISPGCGGAQ